MLPPGDDASPTALFEKGPETPLGEKVRSNWIVFVSPIASVSPPPSSWMSPGFDPESVSPS